jgi:Na+/H+-dicarboxylate symporter
MNEKKKLSLPVLIVIALIAGIACGLLMMNHVEFAVTYIKPFGTIFLNLLKFIVVPIVLLSIICGVMSMKDIKKVGSIGGKTVLFYLGTTAFAISIGLLISNLTKGSFKVLETSGLEYEAAEPVSFMDTIVNIFPSNAFTPLAEANMLQVIVIALLIGFGFVLVGEKAEPAKVVIEAFNEVMVKVMDLIIKLSPIGVFCLITPVVAENGAAVIGSLAAVIGIAYLCYILHMALVYSVAVKATAGISPLKFFKEMSPAMIFAFSSASSVGTLPINLECTEELGVHREIGSFVLPLGATINMDGTAIYQGVSAVFIATCFGIDLTFAQMVTIVLTATLASIGTAGVPGAGLVMLTMVLQSVGLPLEGVALIAGVDRIFDMGRTVCNITGDAACACVVNALEEKKEARRAKKSE